MNTKTNKLFDELIQKHGNPEYEYTLTAHREDTPVEGNAINSDDPKVDEKIENDIYQQLENGNQWAWCMVELTCSNGENEISEYLGCCSYHSEYDFLAAGDYIGDMIYQATKEVKEL